MENEIIPNRVPNVVGMTLRDALPLLENQGLQVTFRGQGRIARQSKAVGSEIESGAKIVLDLS